MTLQSTDDLRIKAMKELLSPEQLLEEYPLTEAASETVYNARFGIQNILRGVDDRLFVIAGPCSIHDPKAALEYAERLAGPMERLKDDLLIVMRVYFEKPRTTVGWKGLINDPDMDDSFHVE
ncbi:MAG: 3-deoxy-7-phosphoheptulonate synthase, partial [Gammaproteobacteria bacterium]|nr:3-deoxy-7-phosphoheptulonate synthase [Gammaproteobacteria bacterium]